MTKYKRGTILLTDDLGDELMFLYEVVDITPDGKSYLLGTDSGDTLRLGIDHVEKTFREVDQEWGKFAFNKRVEAARLESPILYQLNGAAYIVGQQKRIIEALNGRLLELMMEKGLVEPDQTQARGLLVYIAGYHIEDTSSIPYGEDALKHWLEVIQKITSKARRVLRGGEVKDA